MRAALAESLVRFVGVSERRRATVAIGVPVSFWLAVELVANLGLLPLGLAAGLAAFLYTRPTARSTLAASGFGTGVLVLALFAYELYRSASGGSTEPLAVAVGRLAAWPAAGIGLLALGAWLYRVGSTDGHR